MNNPNREISRLLLLTPSKNQGNRPSSLDKILAKKQQSNTKSSTRESGTANLLESPQFQILRRQFVQERQLTLNQNRRVLQRYLNIEAIQENTESFLSQNSGSGQQENHQNQDFGLNQRAVFLESSSGLGSLQLPLEVVGPHGRGINSKNGGESNYQPSPVQGDQHGDIEAQGENGEQRNNSPLDGPFQESFANSSSGSECSSIEEEENEVGESSEVVEGAGGGGGAHPNPNEEEEEKVLDASDFIFGSQSYLFDGEEPQQLFVPFGEPSSHRQESSPNELILAHSKKKGEVQANLGKKNKNHILIESIPQSSEETIKKVEMVESVPNSEDSSFLENEEIGMECKELSLENENNSNSEESENFNFNKKEQNPKNTKIERKKKIKKEQENGSGSENNKIQRVQNFPARSDILKLNSMLRRITQPNRQSSPEEGREPQRREIRQITMPILHKAERSRLRQRGRADMQLFSFTSDGSAENKHRRLNSSESSRLQKKLLKEKIMRDSKNQLSLLFQTQQYLFSKEDLISGLDQKGEKNQKQQQGQGGVKRRSCSIDIGLLGLNTSKISDLRQYIRELEQLAKITKNDDPVSSGKKIL